MSGDDGLLYPLGQRCCGAANMSDCHQYGLCLAVGIHPELAALRAKAAAVDRVRELAEDLESYVAARGRPVTGTYDDGLNRAQAAAAADLRRALDGPPC